MSSSRRSSPLMPGNKQNIQKGVARPNLETEDDVLKTKPLVTSEEVLAYSNSICELTDLHNILFTFLHLVTVSWNKLTIPYDAKFWRFYNLVDNILVTLFILDWLKYYENCKSTLSCHIHQHVLLPKF